MPDIPDRSHEVDQEQEHALLWIDGGQIHESRVTQAFIPPTDAADLADQDHSLSFLFARTLLSILTMIEIDILFTCLLPRGDGSVLLLLFVCAVLAAGLVQLCLATLVKGLVRTISPRLAEWIGLFPPEPVNQKLDLADESVWWEDDPWSNNEVIEETDILDETEQIDIVPHYEYSYQPRGYRKGDTRS